MPLKRGISETFIEVEEDYDSTEVLVYCKPRLMTRDDKCRGGQYMTVCPFAI